MNETKELEIFPENPLRRKRWERLVKEGRAILFRPKLGRTQTNA
jgi:hypothetical protein